MQHSYSHTHTHTQNNLSYTYLCILYICYVMYNWYFVLYSIPFFIFDYWSWSTKLISWSIIGSHLIAWNTLLSTLSASKVRDIALTCLFLIPIEDLLAMNLPKATFWGNEFYKGTHNISRTFSHLWFCSMLDKINVIKRSKWRTIGLVSLFLLRNSISMAERWQHAAYTGLNLITVKGIEHF